MRAEKTNGAKIALFNAGDYYARLESERIVNQPPTNPKFSGGWYVVAIGEELPPNNTPVFVNESGEETTDEQKAMAFDTYGDALKWAVENCAISDMGFPVPRGFERPRYPRGCYLRTYTEITEC